MRTSQPVFLAAGLVILALTVSAAEQSGSNSPPQDALLTGGLGKLVKVPTNEVPSGLLPPPELGINSQIPTPARGLPVPAPVLRRMQEGREGKDQLEWLPSFQPRLMPYLAAQDEYGNTAFKPGPLIRTTPLDTLAQQGKYWASQYGLRYSLEQTVTFVTMTDVAQGDNALGFYTFDFAGKWAVFNAPNAASAGWVSAQIEAKTGLGDNGRTQDARSNLGSITDPTGIWSSVNGFRIPELAWQQSFRDGEVAVVAGMVSQGNYFDGNTYANSGRGQFINSALINSMVMPLPNYAFGGNLQWQPVDEWYAMAGASAGNSVPGNAPWNDFTWETWTLLWELGYTPKDVLGLGPGVYRIQPWAAAIGGATGGGLCFNIQQQLGKEAPVGWFGRFGFGGSDVSNGASAQVATGLGVRNPLAYAGLCPGRDSDALGIGLVWSQPSATTRTVFHENEYALEAGYVMQFTPTMKLQPDLQVVWSPAYNPNAGPALVGQFQMVIAW